MPDADPPLFDADDTLPLSHVVPSANVVDASSAVTREDAAARSLPPTQGPTVAKDVPLEAPAAPPPARFEHYQILLREDGTPWELGRGSMGVTYKALDTRLHCPVALKVINPTLLEKHPTLRGRFFQEARGAARLHHANVASVFHLGERAEDGTCFYAMEFIEGETLESRVRRLGPLGPLATLEMAQQVTRALVAASQQGLVHRDLKPANLMLVTDSHLGTGGVGVKVIDFGLVKAVASTGQAGLTEIGDFVGTPQFASPEQIGSGADGTPDSRSDIYSLGVTMWYALTGKVPFPGRTLAEIHDRQLAGRLPLEQIQDARTPPPLLTLLESMLSVYPDERPQTPHALAEALRVCRLSLPVELNPGSSAPTAVLRLPVRRARRRLVWLLRAAAVIALALAAVALWRGPIRQALFPGREPVPPPTPAPTPAAPDVPPAAPERSLAVLPFDNLSDDKENAFLAEGLQDDLITSLAQIGALKVISRTSVRAYGAASDGRAPASRNLREIGRALGVASILEGSVRRSGNRVRVVVQLIDARTDLHLWANTYDRELSDALSLQSELAKEIAGALHATLSPEETARMDRKPTENADAYVLFLRGREYQTRPDILLQNLQTAERLYMQAVALDPTFALAWARLSQTRSQLTFNYEPTAAHSAEARAAADEAMRLRPDLGETHLALGLCHYWCERDYERALAELNLAIRALPNDAEAPRAIANIRRRQGRWDEALAGYLRALALSPQDFPLMNSLARLHCDRRDWPAAVQALDRALTLTPDSVNAALWRASLSLHWKGDLAPLKTALAAVRPGLDPEGIVSFYRYDICRLERDSAGAERALVECQLETLRLGISTPTHKSYLQGLIYASRRGPGDAERARECFEVARPHYEAAVRQFPRDALRHADLGLLYAALGWREAAIAEGKRAVTLCPESEDAVNGTAATLRLAKIYACLGDAGGAVPLLEHLLTVPTHEWNNFSLNYLRLHPEWDPLRGDARFKRLLATPGAGQKPR